ncbi:MAG: hypothetical protein OXE75_14005 [bacterium]|nr:hypothetical protein [bacterium]
MRGIVRAAGSFALFAAIIVSILAATPRTASACICGLPGEPPWELSENADDVAVAFVGRPILQILQPREDGTRQAIVGYRVGWVYKGDVGPRIAVHTGTSNCGLSHGYQSSDSFRKRPMRGLVAFEDSDGDLWVGLCNSPVTFGELAEAFGTGHPPDDSIGFDVPGGPIRIRTLLLAPVVAAAGILVAYVFAARGARRRPSPYEPSPNPEA